MALFEYLWESDPVNKLNATCGGCNGEMEILRCKPMRRRINHILMCTGKCKRIVWLA